MIEIDTELLSLCDNCLGRIYGKLGHGLSNAERGRTLRIYYTLSKNLNYKDTIVKNCALCSNIFNNLDKYVNIALKQLNGYEFDTFLVGSKVNPEIIEKEKSIQEKHGNYGEEINSELNREIGKALSKILAKEVDLLNPNIVVLVDTMYDSVRIYSNPVFIRGTYKKFQRGIYQTRQSFEEADSVEDYIGNISKKFFEAEDYILHGMGREDSDVLMLGTGRPFILELKSPKKRQVLLLELEHQINQNAEKKIKVGDLRFSSRKEVRDIKGAKSRKTYRVTIKLENALPLNMLEKYVKELEGKVIYQRTPARVLHRRADLVRERTVYKAIIENYSNNTLTITLETDAGLYIKELIHGDDKRTVPSFAEIINQKVEIVSLDVIAIHDLEDLNHE
jgi:tRNA pseudouridine synthase 10